MIESVAVGEAPATDLAAQHLAVCETCQRRLVLARRVESLLARRPVPVPPPRFVDTVWARIRRDRWRNEQQVDLAFNVALSVACLLVAGGTVWLLLTFVGVRPTIPRPSDVVDLAVRLLGPRLWSTVVVYAAATLLGLVALGVWWWAEGREGPLVARGANLDS